MDDTTLTSEQAIANLDDLAANGPRHDCEMMHIEADNILLKLVGSDVAAAYQRVGAVCSWWAYA